MADISESLRELAGQLSEETAGKLVKGLQDPKFCELLQDYAREIADPKAKAEHDAYLAQLEAEGELERTYGQGVQLIQPEPAFVVKTKTQDGLIRVYINICTSDKIEEMSLTSHHGSKTGSTVTIPHSLRAGCNEGTMPSGATFKAFDFVLHPKTLATCRCRTILRETMITMAMEAVERAAELQLRRAYKTPTLLYKGANGEMRPPTLLSRAGNAGRVVDGRVVPMGQPSRPAAAQPEAATPTQPVAVARTAADTTGQSVPSGGDTILSRDVRQPQCSSSSSFSFGARAKLLNEQAAVEKACAAASTAAAPSAGGVSTPLYQVVERARVDMAQAWGDAGRGLHLSNIPQALVVRVELPGVSSAAGVQLDVTAEALSLEVPGKYKLDLPLRYKVLAQQGTAKFNSAKQQLTLTLPVQQPAPEQPMTLQETRQLPQHSTGPEQLPCETGGQDGRQACSSAGSHTAGTVMQESDSGSCGGSSSNSATAEAEVCSGGLAVENGCLASGSSSQQQLLSGVQPGLGHLAHDNTDAADSLVQPVVCKTANQLRWEELHKQAPSDCSAGQASQPGTQSTAVDLAAGRQGGQLQAAPQPEVQCADQQQQQQQPSHTEHSTVVCAPSSTPAPLQLRLSGSHVSSADFV